jgi:hypothetical protein
MEAQITSLAAWPHGIDVELSPQGVLLRPRKKPRVGWKRAFRAAKPAQDDLDTVRGARNKFDAEEWRW